MKKVILTSLASLLFSFAAYGQFDTVVDGKTTTTDQVGIGTTSLDGTNKLTVQGGVNIGGTTGSHLKVRHIDGKKANSTAVDHLYLNWKTGKAVVIGRNGNTGLKSDLLVSGRVRIGNDVAMPTGYQLFVKEGILTEKVKVALSTTADWADYVFEEDYDLNEIEEVEAFVKENRHLPNIPSAKEVVENGLNVAEMDAKLLRQIEELWLHTIDVNKKNAELEAKYEAVLERLQELEK